MERSNHRRTDHLGYSEDHGRENWQAGEERDSRLLRYEVAEPDYDDEDHYEEEEYEEGVKEEVEHRTDEAADDAGQDGFHEKFGLRSRTRHRRGWGRFVPPDTRGLAAPVFVKRPVPGAKAQGGQKEEREPEH